MEKSLFQNIKKLKLESFENIKPKD